MHYYYYKLTRDTVGNHTKQCLYSDSQEPPLTYTEFNPSNKRLQQLLAEINPTDSLHLYEPSDLGLTFDLQYTHLNELLTKGVTVTFQTPIEKKADAELLALLLYYAKIENKSTSYLIDTQLLSLPKTKKDKPREKTFDSRFLSSYDLYRSKTITQHQAQILLGLTRSTFYRHIRAFEASIGFLHQKGCVSDRASMDTWSLYLRHQHPDKIWENGGISS